MIISSFQNLNRVDNAKWMDFFIGAVFSEKKSRGNCPSNANLHLIQSSYSNSNLAIQILAIFSFCHFKLA